MTFSSGCDHTFYLSAFRDDKEGFSIIMLARLLAEMIKRDSVK